MVVVILSATTNGVENKKMRTFIFAFNYKLYIFEKSIKKSLTNEKERYIIDNALGDMAQLVERLVRNEEASGSNPLISTKLNLN